MRITPKLWSLAARWQQAGFGVCTGGYGGVMEAVSRGASESGGRVLARDVQFFQVARQSLGAGRNAHGHLAGAPV